MWERRRITKRGRTLWLLRRVPFMPAPLATQFLRLVLSPRRGVELVVRSEPGLIRLGGWLLLAGALSGGNPLRQIPMLPVTWLVTALLLHLSGRLLGGRPCLLPTLQTTGVALLASPVATLLNLVHPAAGFLLLGAWLTLICYQVHRQVHQLDRLSSAIAAPLPVLAGIALQLALSGAFIAVVPLPRELPPIWIA